LVVSPSVLGGLGRFFRACFGVIGSSNFFPAFRAVVMTLSYFPPLFRLYFPHVLLPSFGQTLFPFFFHVSCGLLLGVLSFVPERGDSDPFRAGFFVIIALL